VARTANRTETDAIVARCFASRDVAMLSRQLEEAQIAFARVNDVASILRHPHLRRMAVATPNGPVEIPAPPAQFMGEGDADFGPLPALGEHTERVRREFLG
jgi:itaconate CoA-transferase